MLVPVLDGGVDVTDTDTEVAFRVPTATESRESAPESAR